MNYCLLLLVKQLSPPFNYCILQAHIAWLENGSQVCLQARYPNYSNNSVQSLQTGSWTHLLPLALGRRFTSKISSNPAASKSK